MVEWLNVHLLLMYETSLTVFHHKLQANHNFFCYSFHDPLTSCSFKLEKLSKFIKIHLQSDTCGILWHVGRGRTFDNLLFGQNLWFLSTPINAVPAMQFKKSQFTMTKQLDMSATYWDKSGKSQQIEGDDSVEGNLLEA